MIPRATYRLQFHRGFTFDDARTVAPYLGQLGISHVYASPILKARAGSLHGYDVTDYAEINLELGGEQAFRRLCATLATHDLKLIVDIVPNHMAAGPENVWWQDLLERGRASPYAGYFDIDWYTFDGKVLAPFLGAPYSEELASGKIALRRDEKTAKWVFSYYDHRFPLRPEDYAEAAAGDFSQAEYLHRILLRQNFMLCWWRTAADAINWRRFFNINDLIALRIDKPEVFEAVHGKIFALVREGLIDGLRVDHVDGLADPAAYCRQLRTCLNRLAPGPQRPYLVVEKILSPGERMPDGWGINGTTGYDFLNDVCALLHDPRGAEPLAQAWSAISGRPEEFYAEAHRAREEILLNSFEAPLAATASAFQLAAATTIYSADLTHVALKRALVRLIGVLRKYRSYATGVDVTSDAGLRSAFVAARKKCGGTEANALEFIARTIEGNISAKRPLLKDAVRRFNQLATSIAAKAVEDTAFYRYGRLLSRNDVGCDPQIFAIAPADFQARAAERAMQFPHTMLATATHDHKRGEDARARLAVLSELPDEWLGKVDEWFERNTLVRPPMLDRGDEFQLYQSIVGAWPSALAPDDRAGLKILAERIAGWRIKSLREAKLRSSWRDPDEDYESANLGFTRAILDPFASSTFLASLHGFVTRIGPAAALNGLVQCGLRFTSPGVPDIFQGTEFWDFSLVDPDNRKPVDYRARATALDESPSMVQLLEHWQDGRVKQALIARLCALRAQCSELFASSSYEPLIFEGPRRDNLVGFLRRHGAQVLLVAVPRLCARACTETGKPLPEPDYWEGSSAKLTGELASRTWTSALYTQTVRGEHNGLACERLFAHFPVAVMLAQ
jgi:(1->4)-alpha-D-glucan 1-alpha-D-glucosylmutase